MKRLLIRLYPRAWRQSYGVGFNALLDETPMTAGFVVDVVHGALAAHHHVHPRRVLVTVALGWMAVWEVVAVHIGVTDNILWAPNTPLRASVLAALLLPLTRLTRVARATQSA